MVSDQQLGELIRSALLFDQRLSAYVIDVSVQDRVVSLSGVVQSFRRKLVAAEIARHFEGVREIENCLEVVPSEVRSDDELEGLVRSSLDAHADIAKAAITVASRNGVVGLSVHVRCSWEHSLAEDIARSVCGVRDVRNLLLVDPFEAAADEQMSQRIQAALAHTRGLTKADIRVAISDASVVLSGEVDQLWQKEAASAVALRFRPVRLKNAIAVRRQD